MNSQSTPRFKGLKCIGCGKLVERKNIKIHEVICTNRFVLTPFLKMQGEDITNKCQHLINKQKDPIQRTEHKILENAKGSKTNIGRRRKSEEKLKLKEEDSKEKLREEIKILEAVNLRYKRSMRIYSLLIYSQSLFIILAIIIIFLIYYYYI